MKKYILIILYSVISLHPVIAQTPIPYINHFDSIADTSGWSHYAISGIDDWERGIPDYNHFKQAFSYPWSWVTDLDTTAADSSERVLETPMFDLSDTTKKYALSFYHQRHSSGSGMYMDYSDDNGKTWTLLRHNSAKTKNWQSTTGFSSSYYAVWQHSAISLNFLQGNDSISFRYRLKTNNSYEEGWMIDFFKIAEEAYNVKALNGDSIFLSKYCGDIEFRANMIYENQYSGIFPNRINLFMSRDTVLDTTDSLMTSKVIHFSGNGGWKFNFSNLSFKNSGIYYILMEHDADDTLKEYNETDNISHLVISVDTVLPTPYVTDFEGMNEPWLNKSVPGYPSIWERGIGYRHHADGTHSGTHAWHTGSWFDSGYISCGLYCESEDLISPYLDMTTDSGNLVLNFWYKADLWNSNYRIHYTKDCGNTWVLLHEFIEPDYDEWSLMSLSLNTLKSENNVRFRFEPRWNAHKSEFLIIDDVYIGATRPDLSIEGNHLNRHTTNVSKPDTLWYQLFNSGLDSASKSYTAFYWSNDSILDASDIFLGSKQEQALQDTSGIMTSFHYSKPTLNQGKYYILFFLDTADVVNEMREFNNRGYFRIYQNQLTYLPYYNNFEGSEIGWRHNATLGHDDWKMTSPKGTYLNKTFSGSKAWISADTGNMSDRSRMHLYSPLFKFTSTHAPVLEFDMRIHGTYGYYGDGTINISYSVDGGATWLLLDTTNNSYNRWYYPQRFNEYDGIDKTGLSNSRTLFDDIEKVFAHTGLYNSRDADRNTRYILDLNFLTGNPVVQFRFNLSSNENDLSKNYDEYEGALIDNFLIRPKFIDLKVNYKKKLMISSVAKEVRFFMHIKNDGNYITNPSEIKFYLSSDTIVGGSDYFLGKSDIPGIRPDLYYYVNEWFKSPDTLSKYNYLCYVLDAGKTNTESNEVNNKGSWELALDSIRSYPYSNNFEDSIVDGWYQHSQFQYYGNTGHFRFRNKLAVAEVSGTFGIESGQMFTERVDYNYPRSTFPRFFLQSPSFNFNGIDSIFISFDLMCTGRDFYYNNSKEDGGNMEFSTDGGNTWNVLDESYGEAQNWYNDTSLFVLDKEPGWTGPPSSNRSALLDTTTFDASFLRGEEHVVFRFKHQSYFTSHGAGYPQGLRLDNFKIEGFAMDYIAHDTLSSANAYLLYPSFNINYEIENVGPSYGRNSKTFFYWSADSVFDPGDSMIHTQSEFPIAPKSVKQLQASITYPYPVIQKNYFLFYKTDADSNMEETNESNNFGSIVVTFDSICGTKYDSIGVVSCDSFLWSLDQNTYTSSGFYSITLPDVYGCDSIVTMNLTLKKSTFGNLNASACDQYTWPLDSNTYYNGGTYKTTLVNQVGCDSIVSLNLIIRSSSSSNQQVSSCIKYTWPQNSITYTSSGIYRDTVTNSMGCDSVITLDLTIFQTSSGIDSVSACYQYTWPADSNTYTVSGTYIATLKNNNGCDSIVTLSLTINNTTTGTENVTSCFSFLWPTDSVLYNSSGTYTHTLVNSNGCDSITTLNLTINTVDTSVIFDNRIITSKATPASYQWINCSDNKLINGAMGKTFIPVSNGIYAVEVTQNSCIDTSACYNITTVGVTALSVRELDIYPNPSKGTLHVVNPEQKAYNYRITNVLGENILSGRFNQDDFIIQFPLSTADGKYIIEFYNDKISEVQKIILKRN